MTDLERAAIREILKSQIRLELTLASDICHVMSIPFDEGVALIVDVLKEETERFRVGSLLVKNADKLIREVTG